MILVKVDYDSLTSGKRNREVNFYKAMSEVVTAFIDSGNDCCEVVDETHMCSNSDTIRISLRRVVSENKSPCKVIRLSGRIYLKRIDGEENGKD